MKHKQSKSIRTQIPRSAHKEHSSPLFLTSSFVFDTAEDLKAAFDETQDAYIYSRYSNPNTSEFIDRMCVLEGAEAGFATASGMAAVFASLMSFLSAGDHVISCASVFGATHTILHKYFPKWGISHSYFDANHPEQIEKLITPKSKILFLETPTNPAIEVIDLALVARIARKHRLLLIVDNCFASPVLQRPIEFGAHLIVHSATKYVDGQGRVLGGCVLGRKDLIKEIYLLSRVSGPALSPFNAWVLSKSIETLALRIEKHCENALYVARALEENKKLEFVRYPFLKSHPHYKIAKKQMSGGGGILTFSLKGGYSAGSKFMNRLKMIKISPNLGDSRSIATHPASSTHCKLSEEERLKVGITPGLIRISVGLEHKEDILEDILQALR
jgi:O-succinylhomoserine sulfhydrylase